MKKLSPAQQRVTRSRLHEQGYKRTKLKELLKPKKSKRKFIRIGDKHEMFTVNGFPINKNGKLIY